jgi:hypothetical protein
MCDRERLWKKPKKLRRVFASLLSVHAPFSPKADIEKHIATFDNSEEQHSECL